MRPSLWWLLASVVAAVGGPATAGTMLYATAATPGRIHGFCVGPGGALAPSPRVTIDTFGENPSRLRVSPATRTLYAAENDRVEVFVIAPGGGLSRPTPDHVPLPVRNGVNSRDIALDCPQDDIACAPTMLYVPERRFQRISTFPLDPTTGVPTSQAVTSCVTTDPGIDFENVLLNGAVSPRLLYASQLDGGSGNVVAYPLDAAGRLVGECFADDPNSGDDPDDCDDGQDPAAHPEDTDGKCDDDPTSNDDDDGVLVPCVGPVACGVASRDDPPICPALGTVVTCPRGAVPCPAEAGGPCLCCRPTGSASPVSSERRRIPGAGAMVLRENPDGVVSECNPAPSPFRLYVTARFSRRIVAFNLDAAGNFDVRRYKKSNPDPEKSCQPEANASGNPIPRQRHTTRTDEGIRYQDLAAAGTAPRITIFGSQFGEGRVDGYRLNQKNRLRGQPSRTTRRDVRTTPVGMRVRDIPQGEDDPATPEGERRTRQVLYVAAGQYDRVQAYRLRADGLPASKDPFSETSPIAGSFPNALALVEVEGACD